MSSPAGEDILSWLDNAISLREAAATAAATPYGASWNQGRREEHKDVDLRYGWDADCVYLSQSDPDMFYQCLTDEIAALSVLHDPASVLRRCAADRRMIQRHQPINCRDFGCDCDTCCATCRWTESQETGREAVWGSVDTHVFPCPTIRDLADGYGWTGGA